MAADSVTAEVERQALEVLAERTDKVPGTAAGVPDDPLKLGDVVELKSGSFPMVIHHIMPPTYMVEGFAVARCVWDLNGVHSGKACRIMERNIALHALKRHVEPDPDSISF